MEVEKRRDQAEVTFELANQQKESEPSIKEKEVAEEAPNIQKVAKDPTPTGSEGIFEACGSIEKL